jgi:hypothetical protein
MFVSLAMKARRNLTELESIAARLRRAAGFEAVRTIDVLSFIENLVVIFPGLKLVRVPDEQLSYARAEANSATNTILIRETIYQKIRAWNAAARFILIEELCHIALGHVGPRYRRDTSNTKIFSPSEQRDEREARQLAALILAPTKFATECNSPEMLAAQFILGTTASEIRWSEVQADQRRAAGVKRELPLGVVDFLTEKQKLGYTVTVLKDE